MGYEHLGVIPKTFSHLGIKMELRGDDIYIPKQEEYEIETFIDGSIFDNCRCNMAGLTPDLLSVLLVTATQANGTVLIHQKMFESRLFFVDKLIDMGAQIILCDLAQGDSYRHQQEICPARNSNVITRYSCRCGPFDRSHVCKGQKHH